MTAIGATVETSLDVNLWKLIDGDIELSDLTPALQGWYVAGYEAGLQATQARLNWEADLWYFVAHNRGKTPADFYASLTDYLWREASE